MHLDVNLPYSFSVLISFLEFYNVEIWPAHILATVLGLFVVWLIIKPPSLHRPIIAILMALFWAWNGIVFYGIFMNELSFMAPLYSLFFLLQSFLLLIMCRIKHQNSVALTGKIQKKIGIGVLILALILYPLIGILATGSWQSIQLAGLSPMPTVLFTIGVLLIIPQKTTIKILLSGIPGLYLLIAGIKYTMLY